MKIRIHPLFVLLLVLSAWVEWTEGVKGLIVGVLVLFSMVIVHELGHVFVATAYGYKIKEMEILPFGGVAKLEHGRLGWNPRHEAMIAVAGPLCNFIMIGIALFLFQMDLVAEPYLGSFIRGNLLLAFFNMLPAFPLDGGRILRAALSRTLGYRKATEVSIRMAFILSLVLILVGLSALWIGYVHMGMITLGGFLLLSAWQLRRQLRYDTIRFLDTKRRSHMRDPLPVRSLVVQPHTAIRRIMDEFAPDAYHMVYVVDGDKQVVDVIGEEELLTGFFASGGAMRTIADHLSNRKE